MMQRSKTPVLGLTALALLAPIFWRSASGQKPGASRAFPAPLSSATVETGRFGLAPNEVSLSQRSVFMEPARGFEANEGQLEGPVDFFSRQRGYDLFLTARGATWHMRGTAPTVQRGGAPDRLLGKKRFLAEKLPVERPSLRMTLVNGDSNAPAGAKEPAGSYSHYFIGHDPSRWRTDVPRYRRVTYSDVYPGIDVTYHEREAGLEYDFLVSPGADPSQIRLRFEGMDALEVNETGHLLLRAGGAEVKHRRPSAYQLQNGRRRPVEASFDVLDTGEIGFAVASYDRKLPLLIDPVLSYSTYVGGSDEEDLVDIIVDDAGAVYLLGHTESLDFPSGTGKPKPESSGEDVVVVKMSPGGQLLYTVFIGGSALEFGLSLDRDGEGNLYLAGSTRSDDFPVVAPLQAMKRGPEDAYVMKLAPSGNEILFSTYLGGESDERVFGLKLDRRGHIVLAGQTRSLDFPVVDAFQDEYQGGFADAFVARMRGDGSALDFATYLGGSGDEAALALALGPDDAAYVFGTTVSDDFPLANPFQSERANLNDLFLTSLSREGEIVYSTYLGGEHRESPGDVVVSSAGEAIVTGLTVSEDFPVMNDLPLGDVDQEQAFITRFSASGSELLYSALLGGDSQDGIVSVGLDRDENLFLYGFTASTNFPMVDALQGPGEEEVPGTVTDAFVTVLDPTGSEILFSTYFGGEWDEFTGAMALGPLGSVFITGSTQSELTFPLENAFQSEFKGFLTDGYVAKIAHVLPPDLTVPTNFRSIGVARGSLFDQGSASVEAGSSIVVLSDSRALPLHVGIGDQIVLDPGTRRQESLFILDRRLDGFRVQAPALRSHVRSPFVIRRAFRSIQRWEWARQGDLVGDQRREVGVLYGDGPFSVRPDKGSVVTIDGSITDPTYFLALVPASTAHHQGRAGGGVLLDGRKRTKHGIIIRDDYTVVIGLELVRFNKDNGSSAVSVRDARGVILDGLLVHDFKSPDATVVGIKGSYDSHFTVRNSIVYDGDAAGIRTNREGGTALVQNCTIYGMDGFGVFEDDGRYSVINTISMGNRRGDFRASDQSFNLSSDESAQGAGSIVLADAETQFVSLVPGGEDFHLAESADAVDAGDRLFDFFVTDIDGQLRPDGPGWDMGADERR